jgi:hypothetical protein
VPPLGACAAARKGTLATRSPATTRDEMVPREIVRLIDFAVR